MALVPLKQKITIERGSELDEWSRPIRDQFIEHKARVDEGTFLIEYRAAGTVTSKEVVAKVRIILDKLQDVRYDDVIVYENELEEEIRAQPKKIDIKRDFSGKPLLTVVYV